MAFLRVLVMVCVLIIPSVVFAHMSTREMEFDRHGVSYGQVMSAAQLQQVSSPSVLVSAPTGDENHLYLVLDGCNSRYGCGTRLTDFAHDLVYSDIGCKQSYKYIGLRVTKRWNDYYQTDFYQYDFVHEFTGYNGWLASTVTTDVAGVKNYHLYVQNFAYQQDYGYNVWDTAGGLYNTGQSSLTNPRIDKYLGFIDYQCSSHYSDDPQCSYFAEYESYKPWVADFTFDEYRDAVGNDKYYINADIPGYPGCYWGTYIETYFLIPSCSSKNIWNFRLCRRESNGQLSCASSSNVTWKFYGIPTFEQAPRVFIKNFSYGQLSKSDFIQDETIYESNGQTYQGFAYWSVIATYQGNSYIIKLYDADPPCKEALEYISGDGQEGLICEELTKPFVVKVTDENSQPESGIGINWQVKDQPESAGASVKPESTQTSSDGLASTYLKLGSSAGEYTVEAACGECTEGSPQTFKATAKCPEVPVYYQGDYSDPYDNWCKYTYTDPKTKKPITTKANCEWENGKLKPGYTQYTIGAKGCTLTSAAMVMSWYGYTPHYSAVDPISLDQTMSDPEVQGYNNGNFNFEKIKKITEPELLVYKRDLKKGEKTIPKTEMDEYLKKCIPVIVQVSNAGSPHYVVVTKKDDNDYIINDPGSKKRQRLSFYKDIYAMRVLYKKQGGCGQ